MSRLIVISNRVSAATGGATGAQGGLSVALTSALRESGGLWFGWSGEVTDEFSGQISFQRDEGVTTATVDLEEQDVEARPTRGDRGGKSGRAAPRHDQVRDLRKDGHQLAASGRPSSRAAFLHRSRSRVSALNGSAPKSSSAAATSSGVSPAPLAASWDRIIVPGKP